MSQESEPSITIERRELSGEDIRNILNTLMPSILAARRDHQFDDIKLIHALLFFCGGMLRLTGGHIEDWERNVLRTTQFGTILAGWEDDAAIRIRNRREGADG